MGSLGPILDVSMADHNKKDWDLTTKLQVISCNFVSAHEDASIDKTTGVTAVGMSIIVVD